MLSMVMCIACGGSSESLAPSTAEPAPGAVETPPIASPAPAAVATPVAPSPPSPPDADGDGVPDSVDNCPTVANPDQRNTDATTESVITGDACDTDDDADGLPDIEEVSLGKDMVLTDPRNPDTDGDGVLDGLDNCPALANATQVDADHDGFGMVCDCNDMDNAIHPGADDVPDIDQRDTNCDGIDGDQRNAIFVAPYGDDQNNGSLTAPVATVGRATALVSGTRTALYLFAGDYVVDGIVWPAKVQVIGGYTTIDPTHPFGVREGRAYPSRLRSTGPSTLSITDPAATLLLEGVTLTNDAAGGIASVLSISAGTVALRYSTIIGSDLADIAIGALVTGHAAVTFEGDWIDPRGRPTVASSVGLWADGGTLTLVNDIVRGGAGTQTEGVVLMGARAMLVHNTIDGSSTGSVTLVARALRFADAAPVLINNVFLTNNATQDQVVLWCEQGDPTGTILRRNLVVNFPSDQFNPLLVDCDGQFFYEPDAFSLGIGTDVAGNLGSFGTLEMLLSLPQPAATVNSGYQLVSPTGVDVADMEALTTITGMPIEDFRDFTGKIRSAPFDVGAIEQ